MDKKSLNSEQNTENISTQIRDANTCIGLGVGVGALGAGSAIAIGATCPLCYVVAPALVGAGLVQRWRVKRREKS